MAEHSTLTGSNLHEPKGIASATAGQVYVADGAASGDMRVINEVLNVKIDDIAGTTTHYVAIPNGGTITSVYSIVDGTVDVETDVTVTNIGTGAVGTLVVATAGAAGDVDNIASLSNTTVAAGGSISVVSDGASTTSASMVISIAISRTA